jgi:hypothetical protein
MVYVALHFIAIYTRTVFIPIHCDTIPCNILLLACCINVIKTITTNTPSCRSFPPFIHFHPSSVLNINININQCVYNTHMNASIHTINNYQSLSSKDAFDSYEAHEHLPLSVQQANEFHNEFFHYEASPWPPSNS